MARMLRTPPTVHAPSSSGLQTDDVLIARGEMRNGFDAASFESAGDDQRVHADASHGAGVDVDGVDFAGRHNFFDLLVNAIERNTFWRIDFDADLEFFGLDVFPELGFRRAFENGRGLGDGFDSCAGGDCALTGRSDFDGLGHGADVRGRRAAAAAEDADAGMRRLRERRAQNIPAKIWDRRCDRLRAWENRRWACR